MAAQWRTINRGGNSIYEKLKELNYDPYVISYYISCGCPDVVDIAWITSVSTT